MSFQDAVTSTQDAFTTVLTKKYADFTGRARRSEYWWYALPMFVASIIVQLLTKAIGVPFLYYLISLAVLVPGLAVFTRRMHDTGRSGWWFLIVFTIIGAFVLLYWLALEGESGTNQYGPSPKEGTGYNPTPNANWGQN